MDPDPVHQTQMVSQDLHAVGSMVQNLIVPYIGKRKVQELRTYDIEKFYATLAKTPCGQYVHGVKQTLTNKQKKRLLSSTSIHEVHTLLKTAFSYAVEWDLIHKIPLPREAPKANSEERTIWMKRRCWRRCRPSRTLPCIWRCT